MDTTTLLQADRPVHFPELTEVIHNALKDTKDLVRQNLLQALAVIVLPSLSFLATITQVPAWTAQLVTFATLFASAILQLTLVRWFITEKGHFPKTHLSPFGELLSPFIVTRFIRAIVTNLGYVFFVIPGIISSISFMLADYVVITQKRQLMDALTVSNMMMQGKKSQTFLYLIVLAVPNLVIMITVMLINRSLKQSSLDDQTLLIVTAGLTWLSEAVGAISSFIFITFQGRLFLAVRDRVMLEPQKMFSLRRMMQFFFVLIVFFCIFFAYLRSQYPSKSRSTQRSKFPIDQTK